MVDRKQLEILGAQARFTDLATEMKEIVEHYPEIKGWIASGKIIRLGPDPVPAGGIEMPPTKATKVLQPSVKLHWTKRPGGKAKARAAARKGWRTRDTQAKADAKQHTKVKR